MALWLSSGITAVRKRGWEVGKGVTCILEGGFKEVISWVKCDSLIKHTTRLSFLTYCTTNVLCSSTSVSAPVASSFYGERWAPHTPWLGPGPAICSLDLTDRSRSQLLLPAALSKACESRKRGRKVLHPDTALDLYRTQVSVMEGEGWYTEWKVFYLNEKNALR